MTLKHVDGFEVSEAAMGTGPVDAIFEAINRIVQLSNNLTEFVINSVTDGIDSQGVVTVRVAPVDVDEGNESDGADIVINPQTGSRVVRNFSGQGTDTDILVAAGRAYLNALNRMLQAKGN